MTQRSKRGPSGKDSGSSQRYEGWSRRGAKGVGAPADEPRAPLSRARAPRSVSASEREVEELMKTLKDASGPPVRRRPTYAPRQLIVKLHADTVSGPRAAGVRAAHASTLAETVSTPFRFLEDRGFIEETVPMFASPPAPGVRLKSAREALVRSVTATAGEDLQGVNFVRLTHEKDMPVVMAALEKTPGVAYVERVPARWPTAMKRSAPRRPRAEGGDRAPTHASQLWNLLITNFYDTKPPKAGRVRVGVLDTGIDTSHPNLPNVKYTYERSGPDDIVGHGTHVAGIIVAMLNAQNSMCGISTCALSVWKIFTDEAGDDGEYYVDEVAYQRALVAAARERVGVINLSIGGTAPSRTEEQLIKRVISQGVTIVAAMGNEYGDGNPTEYPAAYEGVIAVGAVGPNKRRAPFSNTGPHIKLCAPGVGILSTLPVEPSSYRSETGYASWDGTSMATPHVTAAVSLLLAREPRLTPADIVARLKKSVTPLAAMGGRPHSPAYGAGLLNIKTLLA